MASPKLNLVVAACNDGGIGFEGCIPWKIKQDLAFFKKLTSTTQDKEKQNAILVGRKTWFSIPPQRRPLPGRINILLSRELPESPEGAHLARSFKEAMDIINSGPLAAKVESVFVIGGSSLYHEAMSSSCACRIYLTRVMRDFQCDTFLPSINYDVFHKIPNPENIPSEVLNEDDIDFKFEVYEKI